jgi:hypothetical protein
MARFSDDPLVFLQTVKRLTTRADRTQIGFVDDDLSHCARLWELVAVAMLGHAECIRQRDMFRHLYRTLRDGQAARNEPGVVTLDDADWPHVAFLDQAIRAVEHAGMHTVVK